MNFNRTLLICPSFLLSSTQQPTPSSPLPSPVFSDLWSGNQEAGDSLCSSEPNQNRGGALQSSASAANTEGLSGAGMPQLESQQVEGGMFALLAAPPPPAETQAQTTSKGFPEDADVGHKHTGHLSNHHLVYSSSNIMCHFPKCELNTTGWIFKTAYAVQLTYIRHV